MSFVAETEVKAHSAQQRRISVSFASVWHQRQFIWTDIECSWSGEVIFWPPSPFSYRRHLLLPSRGTGLLLLYPQWELCVSNMTQANLCVIFSLHCVHFPHTLMVMLYLLQFFYPKHFGIKWHTQIFVSLFQCYEVESCCSLSHQQFPFETKSQWGFRALFIGTSAAQSDGK